MGARFQQEKLVDRSNQGTAHREPSGPHHINQSVYQLYMQTRSRYSMGFAVIVKKTCGTSDISVQKITSVSIKARPTYVRRPLCLASVRF